MVKLGAEHLGEVFDVIGNGLELVEPAHDGVVFNAATLDVVVAEQGLDPLPSVVEFHQGCM